MTGVVQTERPGKRLNNPFTFIYGTDYALAGWFQQKDLLMYFSGYEKKAWIFLDGQLSGLFQCDLDGNSVVINLGKKKAGRITPYLLFKKDLPENEIADQVRLAALSRFVHNSVNIRLFRIRQTGRPQTKVRGHSRWYYLSNPNFVLSLALSHFQTFLPLYLWLIK
jgi:hypothetical protein